MTPRECSFRLAADGWALAARLETGPILALAPTPTALRPAASFFLGPDDQAARGKPCVRIVNGAPRVVFTTSTGAFGHEGDQAGRLIPLGGARHLSLASDNKTTRFVRADQAGLAWCDWTPGMSDAADPEVSAAKTAVSFTRTPVSRGDVQALEAVVSNGRMLVLYSLPDPVLGVLHVGPDEPRDVRLPLPAPLVHLDVAWVGEQVGVALQLENGQCMTCVLDGGGRTRVRPQLLLGARRDGVSPRVLWSERGFKVAVPCRLDGSVRLVSVDAPDDPEWVLDGVQGPMDAVYFAQRYYFASVTEDMRERAPEAVLQLRSVGRDGSSSQTLQCSLLPSDGSARLRQRALVAGLRALEIELRGAGYRSPGTSAGRVRRGDSALLIDGTPALELAVRSELDGDFLAVTIQGSNPDAGPPPFPRMRRWLGVERDPSESETRHLEALRAAVPHRAARVTTTDSACSLELQIDGFPDVSRLASVVRGLTP